jgi:hypothetical protein
MKPARLPIITITILLLAASAFAQNRKPLPESEQDRYLVSAKSGIVNIVDGDVSSTDDKGGSRPLTARDTLGNRETVRTGSGSRVEVLLNPGCYLRVDENSQFIFVEHPFNNMKVNLLLGSAIIEAASVDGTLAIEVPGNELLVMRSGLYRIDVMADGRTELMVRKGQMLVGNLAVKEGRKVVFNSATPVIAKLDKKDIDGFDNWSKYRARTLIAANKSLSSRALKRSGLLRSINTDVWIFDRHCGCYAFLPGTSYIYSPYGWCYSNYNPYWYRYNDYFYGRGPIYGSPSTPGNGGGGGGGYPGRPGSGNPGGGNPGGGNPGPVTTNPGPRFGGGDNGGRYGSGPERDAPAPIRRP